MQPTLIPQPFSDPEWVFEPKLDGFRGIAFVKESVRIVSRKGFDLTRYFGDIARSLEALDINAVLDGEIVAVARDGRPCFECLQQRIGMKVEGPPRRVPQPYAVTYYAFDVLYFGGYDLTGVSLVERKQVLTSILREEGRLRLVEYFANDGKLVFEKAVEQGLEGCVAKRKDSIYEPGKRSRNWLKAKAGDRGTFLIAGYIESARTKTLQSLVVAQFEGTRLEYKGSVGTGMRRQDRDELLARLSAIRTGESLFAEEVRLDGLPVWVEPKVSVEIRFTQWTHGGYMREPVFVRLVE